MKEVLHALVVGVLVALLFFSISALCLGLLVYVANHCTAFGGLVTAFIFVSIVCAIDFYSFAKSYDKEEDETK